VTPQRRRRIPIIPFQHSEIPALQPVSRGPSPPRWPTTSWRPKGAASRATFPRT